MSSSPASVKFPLVLVNFKTYLEATGRRAVELAGVCERVGREFGVAIAVAPQPTDISPIVQTTSLPVFSQHIDPHPPGSHTGHLLAEAVREAGAVGVLINHSERRLPFDQIRVTITRAQTVGLLALACADTPETCRQIASMGPDAIAIEPPELIGSGIAVSKAKPEVVAGAVEAIAKINPQIHVLCGAGISRGEDISAALSLGTEGVLLASGVVKAQNPASILADMAGAIAHRRGKV